jgi:putative chitinase
MPFKPFELQTLLPRLQGFVPSEIIQELRKISQLTSLQKWQDAAMNTRWRLAHFLGQCAHESRGFTQCVEALNYSAKQLQIVFPKYFQHKEMALMYANQPEKIASRVYANRMGNGDESSVDGFRFRGRGYLQLTGRDNYLHFSYFAQKDCLENPDLVATQYPLISGIFFFYMQSIWSLCDQGMDEKTHESITRRINGSLHGVENRYIWVSHFLQLLTHGTNKSRG